MSVACFLLPLRWGKVGMGGWPASLAMQRDTVTSQTIAARGKRDEETRRHTGRPQPTKPERCALRSNLDELEFRLDAGQ